MRATMRERSFRSRLLRRTLEHAPTRVLDLGTGTGSFAIMLADAAPTARVTGVDPDQRALARAKAKDPERRIDWIVAKAGELPFETDSFDALTCSLVLHHLETPAKLAALRECLRVLAPGGYLQIADWGAASDPLMWLAFLAVRMLDGFARTRAHAAGALPALIEEAGFAQVHSTARLRTCWGTLQLTSALAEKPAEGVGGPL
jgi:ubiquinone/menaquinone biosynthesis C-methylase UbiE